RLAMAGTPVEMYVAGDRAVVLMNNWHTYARNGSAVEVERRQGGGVLLVDISDRTAPRALAQMDVPGAIKTSRLVHRGDQISLYVASHYWGYFENDSGQQEWRNNTVVKSFELAGDALVVRTELDLGGQVTDILAKSN